jgi:hypothetical protein
MQGLPAPSRLCASYGRAAAASSAPPAAAMPADRRRRALVIHPGALGDVLQAVPALRALGRGARVAFCGQPRLGELLAGAGVVEDVFSFDGFGLEALFTGEPAPSSLADRLGRFDEIVSWFAARDERYPERLRALAQGCVVAPPVPEGPGIAVWQHLLGTLGTSRSGGPADRAPLRLPGHWRAGARQALDGLGARSAAALLVVHPGAGGRWKASPPETLAGAISRAIRGAHAQVLLHEGPADREAAEHLARLLDPPALRLVDPALPLLAGILSLAGAYLGGDSGVSHLAAAVGAPAVILYPAATRERWAPWSATARALARDADEEPGVAERAAEALSEAISR